MTKSEAEEAVKNGTAGPIINQVASAVVNAARKKGNAALNRATKELSRVSGLSRYATGEVQRVLQQAEADAQNKYDKVESVVNDVQQDADTLATDASNYAYETNDFKRTAKGQEMASELTKRAQDLGAQIESKLGGLK